VNKGATLRRTLVITYLFLLVAWPVALVVVKTFDNGLGNLQTALSDPDVVFSL
jgi:sulfate/thiosulfate transport system permease protein